MDSSAPTLEPVRAITSAEAAHTLFASFLGWALDAFDFFILIFVMPAVAREFHRPISHIAFTITATLALRPVGALIFGWIADRYGRRIPLMIDVIFYSVVEVLSGLAPSYGWFLFDARAVRNRDGRRMGRGRVARDGSGRAAMARILFRTSAGGLCGRLPARGGRVLLRLPAFRMARDVLSRRRARAADDLHPHQGAGVRGMAAHASRTRAQISAAIRANWKLFLYLCALMTMMNFVSHGTQDMYPTFLEKTRGFDTRTVATIALIYNVGALLGGLTFGYLSDRWGRRRTMATAVICAGLVIPLWIYPSTLAVLTLGAFLMQFMVQGAWGVIPAHLTELSPPEVRGLFSGLAYQTGVLLASGAAVSQALLAERFGYAATLASVAAIVMVLAAVVILLGRERMGRDLHSSAA